ncbi:hypothetical protein [Roseomonas fluvialis]|uniref:FecR N-terminal domain-containing protein n=1 Tax=Roseomonas fluvialis TaxID=1750527 RepID=A0ABM7Y2I3_9PROT|nr:hypothetical protein [Roseomonas fluvialis]BDG71994.1 hypothetical protein Rmf_19230 [Roseomonas fluvialis]
MAEVHAPDDALRRSWHGASDRVDAPEVQAIRLHRAEVEAMMAWRRTAPGSPDQARAWRRLAALRAKRAALMPPASAASLPPLPPAPTAAGGLSAWQKLRRRFGLERG